MFKEPDEPSMFDEIQTVVFANPDKIGKVYRVLDETICLCLICDEVFTRQGAAEHENVACSPVNENTVCSTSKMSLHMDDARPHISNPLRPHEQPQED
jgi:hypothetical protein